MQVVELWRHPVKSMGGERLDSAAVGDLGIDGDRRWGVYDVESATVLTARRTPELLFASARVLDGGVAITLPDGDEIGVSDADRLARRVGRSTLPDERHRRWRR